MADEKVVTAEEMQQAATPAADVREIKLSTGQVYKGTPDQILEQLTKSQEHASLTLQEQKRELEALRQEQAARQAEQSRTVAQSTTGFDPAQYYKLWAEDPLAAQDYADQFRLGVPQEHVRETYQRANRTLNAVEQQMTAARFMAERPEFSGSKEDSNILMDAVPGDRPLTVDVMKSTFDDLVRAGKLKPAAAEGEQTNARPAAPPPSVGGSGGGGQQPDASRMAWEMPLDQLERLIAAKGRA